MMMGNSIYSQDIISFSLGDFGIGYNQSNNEINNFELNSSLLNIFFEWPGFNEDSKARIGLKISPFNLRILPMIDNLTFSFVNMDIFTDFLGPYFIRFGPFASINWLFFEKSHFEPEYFIFSTGLRFTLLAYTESIFRIQFIDLDIGYRRINNENNIYFTIKLDLIDYVIFPFFLGAIIFGKS
jgi:hypothetical protein